MNLSISLPALLLYGAIAQADGPCNAEFSALTHAPSPAPRAVIANQAGLEYLPNELRDQLNISNVGYQGPRGNYDITAGWTRDYYPFRAGDALVSYPSINRRFEPYRATEFIPVTAKQAGFPEGYQPLKIRLAGAKEPKFVWVESRETNLAMQGGQVHVVPDAKNGPALLISEEVITQNTKDPGALVDDILRRDGFKDPNQSPDRNLMVKNLRNLKYQTRTRDQVLDELARVTGVRKERIVAMPWLSGERTGHVDMYVGAGIGDGVVAVPEIPARMVEQLGIAHEKEFAKSTNLFLAERVKQLEAAGLAVKRVPMFPPRDLEPNQFGGWNAHFPTSVGWARTRDTVHVPYFPKSAEWQGEEAAKALREETTRVLASVGLKVEFVDSEKLLATNGTLHCLTAEVP